MIRIAAAYLALLATPAVAGGYGAPPANITDMLDRLVAAYPQTVDRHDGRFVYLKNGQKFAVSDGKTNKSFKQLLNRPDVDDMYAFRYPAGAKPGSVGKEVDPGRIRFEPLFKAIYGDCKKGRLKTRRVNWFGQRLPFATAAGAADALERVVRDLTKLPKRFRKYLKPSAGTFVCRNIAGTRRLSVHSFAAAIDLNVKYTHYWRWTKPDRSGYYKWKNRIPVEIVEVFERHGFAWGGRWYHYDTMHFEYRPELIPR